MTRSNRTVPYTTQKPTPVRVVNKSSPSSHSPPTPNYQNPTPSKFDENFHLQVITILLIISDYTILETPNSSFSSYQTSTSSSSTWQPSSSAGSSYWTNQMTNSNNSPPIATGIQNISPTRSPGSPYATPSPSATYHPLTTHSHNQTPQSYQTSTPVTASSSEFQGNGSPHYHHVTTQSAPPPVVPVPTHQSHQLYYPSSISPTHQIYGNVGFGNFSYAPPSWSHATAADYGLFQNSYHYQPAEYISLINETG